MDRFTFAAAVVFVVISQLTSYYAKPSSPLGDFTATMPPKCKHKTFCTTSHNYPDDRIKNLLNGTAELFKDYSETIGDRYGDEKKSQPSDECRSMVDEDPIYEIEDEQGNIRFVVQSKNFRQIIRIEECQNPGRVNRHTMHLTDVHVKHNNLTCEQCTLNYKFVVLSLDGTSLEAARVKGGVPVCCRCHRNQNLN